MGKQLLLEVSLISSVFVIVGLMWLALRHSAMNPSAIMQKLLTGLLAIFLIMAGTVKFFEPFNTMFTKQIALSGLPLPEIARWAGQLGEISAGLGFLIVLTLSKVLTKNIIRKVFYCSSLLALSIMFVAVYVHLIPEVTAEFLPLQSKPPILTLIIMLLIGLNVWVFRSFKNE